MTKDEFGAEVAQTFDKVMKLTKSKGEEYARSTDQLANFKRQAEELGVRADQVLMVYLNKHLDAIKFRVLAGQSLSESIDSRIDDAILYMILLKAIYREQEWHRKIHDEPSNGGRV